VRRGAVPNPIAPSSVQEAAAERAIIAAPPSREEFDAAMSAAADAVLTLINVSPHTTSDEIREMIETTMRKRFDAAQEKEDEEAPIQALRVAGQPSARHGELTQTVLQAGGQQS
jgi:hypothetical protein